MHCKSLSDYCLIGLKVFVRALLDEWVEKIEKFVLLSTIIIKLGRRHKGGRRKDLIMISHTYLQGLWHNALLGVTTSFFEFANETKACWRTMWAASIWWWLKKNTNRILTCDGQSNLIWHTCLLQSWEMVFHYVKKKKKRGLWQLPCEKINWKNHATKITSI